MAGFDINWGMAQTPNYIGNALGAFQSGMEMGRQMKLRNALTDLATNPDNPDAMRVVAADNPDLAYRMGQRQRETKRNALIGQVFAPEPSQPQPGATAAPVTPSPDAGAPATLIDPAKLPQRTDGLRINQAALRDLYQLDPQAAFDVQTMIFKADEATFKNTQRSGELMARAATHLQGIKLPDGSPDMQGRARELQAMAPQLVALGMTPEMVAQADLTDQGLSRYTVVGQTLASLLDNERADRRLDWMIEDDQRDNARADRNTDSLIADRSARRDLAARGQDVASRDRRYSTDRTSSDRRRGQDVTDKRIREGFGSSGGRRGNKAPATLPRIATKAEYDRLPKGAEYINPNGERMRKK
ncbi:hypothetical protein [Sphingomonas sp.]|uniref:hypothetical protein n=1 Tax=Sphingomonas sp. TaxID=28214 RepID=UPI003BABEBB0